MKELLDLHAFADGELSKEETQRIRQYLAASPEAQNELNAISNLIDCLKEKSPQHRSEECWTACVGRLTQLDRSRKVESFVGRYAWAMCATLFVLVIAGRYAVKDVRGDTANVSDVIRVFHTSQGTPAQQIQQQQLYSDLLRRSKQARSGVKVLSQASGTVLGTQVYRIDLEDKSGPLTFFVMDGVFNFEDASQISSGSEISTGVISNPSAGAGSAVNCVIWIDRERTFVLAGPRTTGTLGIAAVQLGLKSPGN